MWQRKTRSRHDQASSVPHQDGPTSPLAAAMNNISPLRKGSCGLGRWIGVLPEPHGFTRYMPGE